MKSVCSVRLSRFQSPERAKGEGNNLWAVSINNEVFILKKVRNSEDLTDEKVITCKEK